MTNTGQLRKYPLLVNSIEVIIIKSIVQLIEQRGLSILFVDQLDLKIGAEKTGANGKPTVENGQNTHTTIAGIDHNRNPTHTGNCLTTLPILNNHIETYTDGFHCINSLKNNVQNTVNHTGEKIVNKDDLKTENFHLVLECFNCHGFSGTADYVLDRLQNCDIMGLAETWLCPNEVHTIKSALQQHPNFKDTYKLL